MALDSTIRMFIGRLYQGLSRLADRLKYLVMANGRAREILGTEVFPVLALLHTGLMTEKAEGIQAESSIAGLQQTFNNTCLKKYQF